jgi:iron-sulfur cluster assembly protein
MTNLITISASATKRLQHLMQESKEQEFCGIRVSVDKGGCSGYKYVFDYVKTPNPQDDAISQDGFTLFVDPKAVLYIVGTELDYVEEELSSRFIFKNPNEKARCGCGESFMV